MAAALSSCGFNEALIPGSRLADIVRLIADQNVRPHFEGTVETSSCSQVLYGG